MYIEDTITAIATPPGRGGIGIIRLSGERSLSILKEIFVPFKNENKDFKNRYLRYGKIINTRDETIDEVMAVYMKAPASYTREDVVEIHCHGGIISLNTILKETIKRGARLADPGEFTKRAFLNGRIDLTQAEGIMDLITAKTERGAIASIEQIEGGLGSKIKGLRKDVLGILANIEVTIDYPEEDILEMGVEDLKSGLQDIKAEIKFLLDTAENGKIIKDGIKAVIIGRTNVGKSSLLNALLRDNRAIVTDIPGTTRDVIEEYVSIQGIPLKIIDTAGIRDTEDEVEKLGIERSRKNMEDADLIIGVLDVSEPLKSPDREILEYIKTKKCILVLNKTDKARAFQKDEILDILNENFPIIETSLTMGQGIKELEDRIYNMFFKGEIDMSRDIMITNLRHEEALIAAKGHLDEAISSIDTFPLDMVSIDLRDAIDSLGRITGETATDDLIDKIFSEFCLGK